MTIPEFLVKLAALDRTWTVSECGYLRCAKGDCPALAVAGGNALLDMPYADTNRIFAAADNRQHHDSSLRRQLLDAVGLQDQA